MRLAKAIEFVEPDWPLPQPLAEVLEEELEPTWRIQLDDVRAADSVSRRLDPRLRRYGLTESQFGVLETLLYVGSLSQPRWPESSSPAPATSPR
jgi:hypothetical protein